MRGCDHSVMSKRSWAGWATAELDVIESRGRLRATRVFDAAGPAGSLHTEGAGTAAMISFASNDYLGLSTHPDVLAAAHDAIDRWGAGSTASRLVVGTRPVHEALEAQLARWKGTEAALVFPSGYAANTAVLGALGGLDCTVVSDELNHASIIDGCRLSRSPVIVSRHSDVEHVESALRTATTARAVVVTDAVFSMDGDEAPVEALARVCARHGALFVLDEAHSVLGPDTRALDEIDGLEMLRVVTLSKALGAMGGAVCGASSLVELLVNRARSFVFSTALSPSDAAAAQAAITVVESSEGAALIGRLRSAVDRVRPGHPSPIIPVVIGEEHDAVRASSLLAERGLLIPAIRPPTVPPGTSRLRVALSASHTDTMIDELVEGLAVLDELELCGA